jgi:aspartyl protease family protein
MEFKHFSLLGFGLLAILVLLKGVARDETAPQQQQQAEAIVAQANTPAQISAPQSESASSSQEGDDDDAVVLQRKSDGHFYARANVNGGSVRFLVDTGASYIALTGDDAREIGLDWNESDLRKIGRGASGDVFGKTVMLSKVKIGSLQAENVPAAIIPEGLDVSLLGQSFLETVGSVNIANDRMVLK